MAQPLTDAIEALTTYANTVTGKTPPDTTLSDAVATLASGYGGGGYSANTIISRTYTGIFETTETVIGGMFYGATFEEFKAPNATSLANYFPGDYKLYLGNSTTVKKVYLPNLRDAFGRDVFKSCSNLEEIYAPHIKALGPSCLEGCAKMRVLVFQEINGYVYEYWIKNSGVHTVDLNGNNVNLSQRQNIFNTSNLNTLILRSGTIRPLGNINSFNNSPFKNGGTGGTLYVPSALISSYQTASNWSTILGYANNSIQAIEGSYYETHYADGTPIE